MNDEEIDLAVARARLLAAHLREAGELEKADGLEQAVDDVLTWSARVLARSN
jgi:hypothetical protein